MTAAFTVRPARMDEVEAVARLLNEHSRRLFGVDDQPVNELRQYWESPDVDFDNDVLVAEGRDGSLVGYADLGVHADHVWLDLRGMEPEPLRALLEAIEERAASKKPDANFIGYTSGEDALVRELGLRGCSALVSDGDRPRGGPRGAGMACGLHCSRDA